MAKPMNGNSFSNGSSTYNGNSFSNGQSIGNGSGKGVKAPAVRKHVGYVG